MASVLEELAANLRDYALSLPEAYEDFPWGERVIKVNKKIFVFMGEAGREAQRFSFGVKLPMSSGAVLQLPNTKPSGYNLGKSGWVTVDCLPDALPSVEL